MYALKNVRIYDFENFIDNAYVVFSDQIIAVGKMADFDPKPEWEVIDGENQFLLPGFVAAHTHLYSTFARGMSVPFAPQDFLDILKQLWWKMDHFLDSDMIYYSALMGGIDQLLNGTTTLIDHHASHLVSGSLEQIAKALKTKIGMRGIYCFETSDRFDVPAAIKENNDFIKNHKNAFEAGLFGMHAALSLSDETLAKIKAELQGAGIHIHVAESLLDEKDSLQKYGKRVVKRLDDFGLINDKSILVHTTHIDDDEMDIIKQRNATVAVNVTSNLNNAVGIANIRKLLDKGIKVMIGNDGLIQSMPSEYMNVYYLTHLKQKSPLGMGLDDVKKMINEGYRFVGEQLGIKIGKIKSGYVADLQLVPYQEYTELNEANVFGHVFYGMFPGFKPRNVFVNGKLLVKDYRLNIAIDRDYKIAKQKAAELWKTIAKAGDDLLYNKQF